MGFLYHEHSLAQMDFSSTSNYCINTDKALICLYSFSSLADGFHFTASLGLLNHNGIRRKV